MVQCFDSTALRQSATVVHCKVTSLRQACSGSPFSCVVDLRQEHIPTGHVQGWVPRLERKLEIAAESAHPDFRCFFSAEPINGAPFAKIVPESILQVSFVLSNVLRMHACSSCTNV